TATTTVQLTVNKATPSITWASPAAITYGTALSATQLNASSATAGTFAYTPASGVVLGAGPQILSVTFTPTDATNYASATATVQLTVNKATPALSVSPASASINTLQADQVTVTINGGAGNLVPTGTVTLSSGSYSAQQSLTSGSVTFSVIAGALAVGNDTLTATYTPDSASASTYNNASQAATVSVALAIGTGTSTVTVSPSASTITDLSSLAVSVTVAAVTGQATPTGSVTLSSGSYSAQLALVSGKASFTVPAGSLASGADTLLATYSGDPTYSIASGTATVTVSPFVLSAGTMSPITAGSQGTDTLNLSAGSTYSGTVNLTCTLTTSPAGASSLPTCTVVPATVTLTAGGNGTSVFTVKTTAASTTAMAKPSGIGPWGLGGGTVLAGLLMFGIASRRRHFISLLTILLIVVAGGTIGCGGKFFTSTSGSSTPATTAGTYVFTVAGTDSANAKLATSTTVTITVQ
ncbi:MAG: Ig-like domain repeat protein, partial [Terracidiphilus sp.]|nr:Ig-like domain repeat protein [Terracidiphilus sp.]